MNFQPVNEADLKKSFPLIPKGEYDFEVLSATDKTSSKGNDMIEVNIIIWQGENQLGRVFDYLLPAMEAKLRHACDACGLLDKYQAGNVQAEDFVGRTGRVKIKVGKPKGDYPAKNEVEDYLCRPAKPLAQQGQATQQPTKDEDLPF